MVWVLPSKGRPRLCQEALDACGEVTFGLVIATGAGYESLVLPKGWGFWSSPWTLGRSLKEVFKQFPLEPTYGFVADDMLPRTPGWSQELELAADGWFLAGCEDQYISHKVDAWRRTACGAMCWGGNLIRSVGWWVHPEIEQVIENLWIDICDSKLHLRRHLEYVLVEHRNFRTKKRDFDETDQEMAELADREVGLCKGLIALGETKLAAALVLAAMEAAGESELQGNRRLSEKPRQE